MGRRSRRRSGPRSSRPRETGVHGLSRDAGLERETHEWIRAQEQLDGAPWPGPLPLAFSSPGGFAAIVGHEHVGDRSDQPRRWRISLRGPGRIPTWAELVDVAHALCPGVPFVVGIPPREWWLNVDEDTLHAWETRDEPLIEEWRAGANGDVPSGSSGARPAGAR